MLPEAIPAAILLSRGHARSAPLGGSIFSPRSSPTTTSGGRMRGTRRSTAKIILPQDSRHDRLPGKGPRVRTTLLPFEMDGAWIRVLVASRRNNGLNLLNSRPRLPRFLDRQELDRSADTTGQDYVSPIPDIARPLLSACVRCRRSLMSENFPMAD
jgi:hypothetical protein